MNSLGGEDCEDESAHGRTTNCLGEEVGYHTSGDGTLNAGKRSLYETRGNN